MASERYKIGSESLSESVSQPETATPQLPKCLFTKNYYLCKSGPNQRQNRKSWGLVLRGTTSELEGGLKVYTCHVDEVAENGEAKVLINAD